MGDLIWTAVTLLTLLWSVGVAVLILTKPLTTSQTIGPDRAFFTAAAAVSSTGFAQGFATPADFNPLSQAVLIAINVGGTLVTWVIGGVFVLRLTGRSYRMRLFIWPLLLVVAVTLVLALTGSGYDAPGVLTQLGWHFGVTVSPTVRLLLAMIGSVGLAMLMAPLLSVRHLPAIRASTLWAWAMGAMVVCVCGLMLRDGVGSVQSAGDVTRLVTYCVELRTSHVAINTLTREGQWLTLLLSFIGSAPASSAGGFGVIALMLIGRSLLLALTGRPDDQRSLWAIALIWVAMTFALILITLLLLLAQAPQLPADRAVFLASSAAIGTGISHDPVSLTDAPLYTLGLAMIAGKLLPLFMLGWMARRV